MRSLFRLICLGALISLPLAATAQPMDPGCVEAAIDAADAAYCECQGENGGHEGEPMRSIDECTKRALKAYAEAYLICTAECVIDCLETKAACLEAAGDDFVAIAACFKAFGECSLGCVEIPEWQPPDTCDPCLTAEPTWGCRVNGKLGFCVGTNQSDVILGTDGRDVILCRGGDDYAHGFGKKDLICGGGGDDVLIGGTGGDTLSGQRGDDHLEGLGGRDALDGGPGNDYIDGGAGQDTCTDPNDGNQTFPFILCEITP